MPNSLLAIKTTLFAVSTLVHAVRCSRDLPARRWRPSTAAATVGWLCYAVVFSVAVANAEGIRTSLEILAPSALWLLKLSVSLLLLHLGVRATVVWLLITYLATTWAAVVAFRLALCRPWDFETECTAPAAVWAYTGLDIVGYVLVMAVPLCIFRCLAPRRRVPIIALVALSGGLIAASLAHALLVESTNPMLPDVLVDVELALALVLASLPSLCFFASSAVPVPPVAISDKAPAQELMVVDPRRLGVLPDSMPESFQSSRSTTPVQEEAPPVDWRAGDGESERQLRRDVRSMSLGGGSAYGGLGELGEVRREEWEGIGDVEEGWGGK